MKTIEERANLYAADCSVDYNDFERIKLAYLAGAKDTEANPAWRMCEDELPEDETDVIVACSNGDRGIGCYEEEFKEWYMYGEGWVENIIAWLPLPKFNPRQETK